MTPNHRLVACGLNLMLKYFEINLFLRFISGTKQSVYAVAKHGKNAIMSEC